MSRSSISKQTVSYTQLTKCFGWPCTFNSTLLFMYTPVALECSWISVHGGTALICTYMIRHHRTTQSMKLLLFEMQSVRYTEKLPHKMDFGGSIFLLDNPVFMSIWVMAIHTKWYHAHGQKYSWEVHEEIWTRPSSFYEVV